MSSFRKFKICWVAAIAIAYSLNTYAGEDSRLCSEEAISSMKEVINFHLSNLEDGEPSSETLSDLSGMTFGNVQEFKQAIMKSVSAQNVDYLPMMVDLTFRLNSDRGIAAKGKNWAVSPIGASPDYSDLDICSFVK